MGATQPQSPILGEILHCETNECAVFRTSCIRRRTRKDPSSSETFIQISQSRSSTATNEEVPVGGGWSDRGGAWAVMITLRLRSGGSQAFLHRGQNCNVRLRRREALSSSSLGILGKSKVPLSDSLFDITRNYAVQRWLAG